MNLIIYISTENQRDMLNRVCKRGQFRFYMAVYLEIFLEIPRIYIVSSKSYLTESIELQKNIK